MKRNIVILIIALILLAGTWFLVREKPAESPLDNQAGRENIKEIEIYDENSKIEEIEEGGERKVIYRNTKYNFSVLIPAGFNVASFKEGEYGDIILIKNQDKELQFFISEFDEPGPITKQRILQDLPEMIIENEVQVIIGKNKITALLFDSLEESNREIKEIWFIKNGYLYQISTARDNEKLMGEILETLEF